MNVEIIEEAEDDLRAARRFYEDREPGIGAYFILCIGGDVESLRFLAGIHPVVFGFHRALSKRFPFGIYYRIEVGIVRVFAVLDLRRCPAWIRRQLRAR